MLYRCCRKFLPIKSAQAHFRLSSKTTTFVLIAAGTVIGLAGTDLVLPAIPSLPDVLGGSAKTAQWVLAAFVAGTGIGLLAYGELGTRFKIGSLLVVSLFAYAFVSVAATYASSLYELSVIRFFQGITAAAPAVFAPVMIKSMYGQNGAVAMLGRIGSIESITPALAPILGAWLLRVSGWDLSFYVTAVSAFMLGTIWLLRTETRLLFGFIKHSRDGYLPLLHDRQFMRSALSQAFNLGALLIIVFAAPAVITLALQGELSDFIVMQVLGISFFVVSANMSHMIVARLGDKETILLGSTITAAGCLAILGLGFSSSPSIEVLWFFFVFVNLGLGIRGPAGFYLALQAAGENESRGSALVVLFVMLTTAVGTFVVAPFVEIGLLPVATVSTTIAMLSVWLSRFSKADSPIQGC